MKITIEADFTDEELLAVLQKVRDIDQPRRDMVITIWACAPELSTEQVTGLLNQVKPPFPHRHTVNVL